MRPHTYLVLNSSLGRAIRSFSSQHYSKFVNQAQSGQQNFEKDYENSHVPTTSFQKLLLSVGSGVISIMSPSRGDMVAVMGEVTGSKALEYMRSKMLETEEGKKILDEKPRISSATVDLQLLKSYPEGSLGKAYSNFLEKYGYSPDERNAVRFVDDIELAYVAQRYREVHDLLHTIFHMPTDMLGEVTVKWIEAAQTRLPMCVTGALFGSARLGPKFSRSFSTKVRFTVSSKLDEEIQSNIVNPKRHPGRMTIKCESVPEIIVTGIKKALKNQDIKLLIQEGQKCHRMLMGRKIPLEQDFREQMKAEIWMRIANKHNVTEPDNADPKVIEKINKLTKRKLCYTVYNWSPIVYTHSQSLKYMVIRSPAEYAAVKRVFNEILLRDKDFQPRAIFDFGSGVGTVVWAAHQCWGSTLQQYFCVDSSKYMNNLASLILQPDEESDPIIKSVYYRQFLPMTPSLHDIVISSFSLFELKNFEERSKVLTVLWNNTGRYLVLIENGTNAGHDILDEAKRFLLEVSSLSGVDCHVFAPCPHELTCPRLTKEGKRTPCNFQVSYLPLPISELVNTADKLNISFLILKKEKAPLDRQSRIVRNIIKRHKHVVCELCTTQGDIKTVFVTRAKTNSSTYKCMRHSSWGDLTPPNSTLEFIEDTEELISDEDTDSDDSSGTTDGDDVGSRK